MIAGGRCRNAFRIFDRDDNFSVVATISGFPRGIYCVDSINND